MKKITIDLKAEDLRKKLNLKDGTNGRDGRDGKDGTNGLDGKDVDIQEVIEKVKPLIPSKEEIANNIPILGEKVRDSLELLTDENRLSRTAIDGLDDYEEIARLARKPKKEITKYFSGSGNSGGGGTQDLQSVTDEGATTSNVIEVQGAEVGTDGIKLGDFEDTNGDFNILNGGDKFYQVDTSKEYLQFVAGGFALWYYPDDTANPPVVSVGDKLSVILWGETGFRKDVTIKTITHLTSPVPSYQFTFEENFTPTNNVRMQITEDLILLGTRPLDMNGSIINGFYNTTPSFTQGAFITGNNNSDTASTFDALKNLTIIGNSNNTKNGIYIGSQNTNTRGVDHEHRTIMIGNSNSDSSTAGSSVILGENNTFSGSRFYRYAFGEGNTISNEGISVGFINNLSERDTVAIGKQNNVSGRLGSAIGLGNNSRSFGEVTLGVGTENITPLSATTRNPLDWQLRLGSGTSVVVLKDIFRIRKNGEMWNLLDTTTAVGHTIKLKPSHTANAIEVKNSSDTVVYNVEPNGVPNAPSYKANGTQGVSGSFTSADGKTVTVTGGIITSII